MGWEKKKDLKTWLIAPCSITYFQTQTNYMYVCSSLFVQELLLPPKHGGGEGTHLPSVGCSTTFAEGGGAGGMPPPLLGSEQPLVDK